MEPAGGAGRWFGETAIIIVSALVLSALVRAFLVQAFFVPSASMEDTTRASCPGITGAWPGRPARNSSGTKCCVSFQ